MKKTLVSLAAASLIVTSAMAADKGIDIVTTGQAVVYYETQNTDAKGDADLFNANASQANVGLQLNLDADLKNNFTFGSQVSYLGTAGLERNLVSGTKQGVTSGIVSGNDANASTTNNIALTKIFIAKKIGNTTAKIGRQELPKSLSPFAFSEGWNVFKNTFDAILAVNTDIPDTTVVGAYVSGGTSTNGKDGGITQTSNLKAVTTAGGLDVTGNAYMLTVANKSIPMTAITLSYYNVARVNGLASGKDGATAMWGDVKVAGKDLPLGLKFGLQGGQLGAEADNVSDTMALGAKIGMKPIDALSLCVAYTSVDADSAAGKENIAVKNFGTGVKTPLYTQMVYNQNAIALDADTFMLKAVYNTGDYGKVIAQYANTAAGKENLQGADADYNEFDLIYKVKAAGVQYFAAYLYRSIDNKGAMLHGATGTDGVEATTENRLRFWARYNF